MSDQLRAWTTLAVLFSVVSCGGKSDHETSNSRGGAGTGGDAGSALGGAGAAGRGGNAGNDIPAGSGGDAGNDIPAGSGGDNTAGAGEDSGSGGGGEAGSGGRSGAAGEGGMGENRYPCGTALPVIDATTGLESCSAGYVRRTGPAHCVSDVPRSEPVSGYNPAIDECEFDADCAGSSTSAYAHCAPREGGFARVCVDGCVSDADCAEGRVCRCDAPVGRCVPATCSTGADCEPGFDCAEYQAEPGCASSEFACQTPADVCVSGSDCDGFSVNPTFCRVEGTSRVCTIDQCTTP